MFKLAAYGLTLLLCVGTAGLLANNSKTNQSAEAQLATDGAYRDGLYMGRLAAQHGQAQSPQTGRWSSQHDRTSFLAGYERGYNAATARR